MTTAHVPRNNGKFRKESKARKREVLLLLLAESARAFHFEQRKILRKAKVQEDLQLESLPK